MTNSRNDYINSCKETAVNALKQGKSLVQYVRTKKGQPRGVVVAFRDPNSNAVRIGWSLCNIKVDKFDKSIGLAKAVENAEPMYSWRPDNTPVTVVGTARTMLERASRFFKPQVSKE